MSTLTGRINTLLLVVVVVVGLAIVAMLATGARGGPLDPTGSPAPTDGVREAGTPISSLPFTISTPGRYYVTRDLTGVSGQSGVTISASDVTLDLNGFTLHGVAGAIDGVLVSGARTHVTMENGGVRGWYNGIDAQTAAYSLISHVDALSNGGGSNDGSFGIIVGGWSVLENCNVNNNKATGILAFAATIRNCRVSLNGNDGIYTDNAVHLDGNDVINNGNDVRFSGANFASENFFGYIVFDRTNSPSANVVVRNVFCSAQSLGAQPNGDNFPATGAEFNGKVC